MKNIKKALCRILNTLSQQNYEQSLASYRLLLELEQTYSKTEIGPDLILNSFWEYRTNIHYPFHTFVLSVPPLILRFINDAESGRVLPFRCSGLRGRFCARLLEEFFDTITELMCSYSTSSHFSLDVNLIAHCANLGYLPEAAIRNHILQSLSYVGSAEALCTLFKIAGATFDAYVDRSLVDYCFEFLKGYKWHDKADRKQSQVNKL